MTHRTALIVGAGIGGLAAGVALRRAGWRVRIVERAVETRALGFALSLAPNAMEALRELGLAERLTAEGCVVGQVEIRRADGSVLKRFHVAAELAQAASVFALRRALHGALLDATEPATLSLGSEAVAFESTGAGVVLTFKDGRSETGDVLIGADGVGSVIRRLLHPDEPPPRRSGYFGVRGVAYEAADCLGRLSAVAYLGHGIEAATVRASQDAVYWYVSMLADDLPLMTTDPDTLLERCASLLDDGFRRVIRATRSEDVRLDEFLERDPIESWGQGRATLLGDAAHPMRPHTGQGAAQALEDAVALGLALTSGGDPERSLRAYERVRSARTERIVRRGPRIAGLTTTKSGLVGALRTVAIRAMPARALAAGFLLARRIDPHRALR
jgi:2-polyprenyl-6-methoxyphenol hydroxylase-like FAD-dependent oxidoreductase